VLAVLAALDTTVRSAQTLALLAVLAAIGAAVRIASTGVGGVEALFVLLILAGRAYGARFGLLLGAASVGLSALLWEASGRGCRSRCSPARGSRPAPGSCRGACAVGRRSRCSWATAPPPRTRSG
jgi:hypothetical protein